ncbi:bifunctional phosphopantothenoylcysteine decarboxylase/phosphopantothenate--cysteine ligase CoaBC [Bacteroidota bacterium]
MMLKNKKILIGITGSIAAYKAAILVRLLVKEKAEVKIVMTSYAKEFITPLTLSTLSNNPVYSDFFERDYGTWHSHVSLAEWADLFLIAPATANTIGKMANGIADNLLLTTYMSAKCPVIITPAMDLDMFKHPANQVNLKTLKQYGNTIFEPTIGELASGLEGKGRMQEPEDIVKEIKAFFSQKKSSSKKKLLNKNFLVTAGPTYEMIDPVRFIGNFSSGKMGYAIAEELANQGAKVKLISGPVNITINHPNIETISVTSANEMFKKCLKEFKNVNGAVLSAAVSDFTSEKKQKNKIKSSDNIKNIALKQTKDIAKELGKIKSKNQVLVGFALETENEIENAKKKLKAKNFDFIVLNSLNEKGAGFNVDTNKITTIDNKNNILKFDLKNKIEVAKDIVNQIIELI